MEGHDESEDQRIDDNDGEDGPDDDFLVLPDAYLEQKDANGGLDETCRGNVGNLAAVPPL